MTRGKPASRTLALLIAATALATSCGNGDETLIASQQETIDAQSQKIDDLTQELDQAEDDVATAVPDTSQDELSEELDSALDLAISLKADITDQNELIATLETEVIEATLKLAAEADSYSKERSDLTELLLPSACELGTSGLDLESKTNLAEIEVVAPQLAELAQSLDGNGAEFLFELVEASLTAEYDRCALAEQIEADARFAAAQANFEPIAIGAACDGVLAALGEDLTRRTINTRISDFTAQRFQSFITRDDALSAVWSEFDSDQKVMLNESAIPQVKGCIRSGSGYTKLPIGSGTWYVGEDVAVGSWRSETNPGDCYWARNDANGNIRANNFISGSGPVQFRISSGDNNVEISDCGTFVYIG